MIFLKTKSEKTFLIPLYKTRISAGFPSPADDFIDKKLDLNEHLIKHPSATFFLRVEGHSMVNAGIHDGDLLIVDRSLKPSDQKIVVAVIHGELTVKRVELKDRVLKLMPENESYKPIVITDEMGLVIWGVVTHVIHAL